MSDGIGGSVKEIGNRFEVVGVKPQSLSRRLMVRGATTSPWSASQWANY
jgi:hypothetical protein